MPEYRGAWLFALTSMKIRARLSTVKAVHITDPQALTTLGTRKLMATVYDLIPLKQGLDRRRLLGWAGYQVYLRALKRVDTYFAISEHTATDLVKLLGIPRDRIVVAPPGVDLPANVGAPSPAVRPYFLFLGGPDPNKNLSVLLGAVSRCADLNEELRIAGRWLPKQVSALNVELTRRGLTGRVRHIGFVPDEELLDLLVGATALIVPSKDEGFGLPVGEALAAGAAVVHSRIAVLEETSAGAALTFDPDSPEELATCLRRVARDTELAHELRRQGIKRSVALNWDLAFERTMAAYRAMVAP
jgi:glycosyltransferase involved in cell wall biosynthesis